MKKLVTTIGLIAAIVAVLLSVTPLYNLTLVPGSIAILCAGILYYLKKKTGLGSKFMEYITVLCLMAVTLSIYKILFSSNEVENVEAFEQKEEDSVEDSIELLEDIDIEE